MSIADHPRRRAGDTPAASLLRILQLITLLIAFASLTVAVIGLIEIPGTVTTARRQSAYDSCYLLRGVIFHATTGNPAGRKAAERFINRTSLRDCMVYARTIVR